MCSMKWATPTWPGPSRREPARTYAAMETERAAGSRALITRGPAGRAVRSNIRPMVADCGLDTSRHGRRLRMRAAAGIGHGLSFGRPSRPGTVRPRLLDRACERIRCHSFGPVRAPVEEES